MMHCFRINSWELYICYLKQLLVFLHILNLCPLSRVVSRVLKTLHGSSDDIGWLQSAPGMAPVVDGSARFVELLQGIRYHISIDRRNNILFFSFPTLRKMLHLKVNCRMSPRSQVMICSLFFPDAICLCLIIYIECSSQNLSPEQTWIWISLPTILCKRISLWSA